MATKTIASRKTKAARQKSITKSASKKKSAAPYNWKIDGAKDQKFVDAIGEQIERWNQ